jgi:hypothetical protein
MRARFTRLASAAFGKMLCAPWQFVHVGASLRAPLASSLP